MQTLFVILQQTLDLIFRKQINCGKVAVLNLLKLSVVVWNANIMYILANKKVWRPRLPVKTKKKILEWIGIHIIHIITISSLISLFTSCCSLIVKID